MWLVACATELDSDDPPAPVSVESLAAPGPWSVGHRDDELGYTDPGGDPRSLHLSTWYPTTASSGTAATYFSGLVTAEGVWQDATPAAGPFPQVLFSHGHQGYAENSSFLCEHLASHGWVVTAPDHTGNTTFDGDDRSTEIYWQRPADLAAVDGLDLPLSGEIVAMGHSFGGYTVWAAGGARYSEAALACPDPEDPFCLAMDAEAEAIFRAGLADGRLRSVLAMAPGDYDKFEAGLGEIDVPSFHMTASEDQPEGSEADDTWAALPADKLRLVLEGGGHQSFTDFSDQLEDVPMTAETSWRIVKVYALAWARASLGDDAVEPILSGELAVDEAAVLMQP